MLTKPFISVGIRVLIGLSPLPNSTLAKIIITVTGDLITCMFPSGRALKLIKNGVNIINSTNPFQITKTIILTVLDCCASPPIRLAAHCIGAGAVIAVSIASLNPVTIGSVIHLVSKIYDNC